MRAQKKAGLSLPELLVTMSLFGILALVTVIMMKRGGELWVQSSGQHSASLTLASVDRELKTELEQASSQQVGIAMVPGSLSVAPDGSAVWFLSARDPSSGLICRKPDGSPFWQANILYYLVVPNHHRGLYGFECLGGPDSDPDTYCPHKVLVKKVIDYGTATSPATDPLSTEEVLLASEEIEPYLTRPMGLRTSNMLTETGVESVRSVAQNLLTFQVTPRDTALEVRMRVTALENLGQSVRIGHVSLVNHSSTLDYYRMFFPKN